MNTCKHCGCNSDFFGCWCQDHSEKLNKMLSPEELERLRSYTSDMMARLDAIERQPDFAKLWAGRPKDEPLPWIVCPIYVFNFNKGQWIPRPV